MPLIPANRTQSSFSNTYSPSRSSHEVTDTDQPLCEQALVSCLIELESLGQSQLARAMNGEQRLLHCRTIQINKRPTAIVESPPEVFQGTHNGLRAGV